MSLIGRPDHILKQGLQVTQMAPWAMWMITARFLPSLKTFRTPNPCPLSRLLAWEAPKFTHSRSPLMSVMALNLIPRHGAARFHFHAFCFFRTSPAISAHAL